MRIAVLALLVALCPFLASAQPIQGFDWGQVIDTGTEELVNDVAIGPLNGDRYAAGTWTRTTANSQTSLGGLLGQVLTWLVSGFSLQGEDGMILSYPAGGGAFQWAVIIGGSGNDGIHSICTDAAGNLYVAGYYSNGARIIQPNGTYFEMPATQGGTDLFVASFTATGTHRWHRVGGGAGADVAKGIAWADGKVFVTGQVIGRPVVMGLSNTTSLGAVTQANAILLKLDDVGGTPEWRVDGHGGTSTYNDVVVDGDRAYLIGTFDGANCTAYHPGGAQSPQIAGSQQLDAVLMAVHRSSGAPIWLRSIRSPGGAENEANGIALDGTSVYLCGSTHNGSSFTGTTYNVTGSPHSHGYVSKHRKTDGGVEWMLPFSSSNHIHGVTLRDIQVDASNTIWTTGAFYRDLNSNSTNLATTTNNRWQLSTLQLAWNGTLIKGYAAQGNGDAVGNGVAIDGTGRVFVGGEWRTLVNLKNSHTHTGDASNNLFVTGMTDPGFPMWSTNVMADWVPFGPLCSNAASTALNTRLRPLKFGTGKTVVQSNNIPSSGANGPQGALGTPDEGQAVLQNATAYVRIDLVDTIPAGASVTVRWLRTAASGTGQLLVSGSMAPATGFVSLGTPSSSASTIVHTNLTVTSPIRYIRVAAPVGSAEIAVSGVYYAFGTLPGGTWSGSGVSGSTFSPAGLNGAIPLTYSVSGHSKSLPITVEALVVPGTISGGGSICPGTDQPLTLNGSSSIMSMWQIMPQGASVWTNTASYTSSFTLPYVTVPHQVRVQFAATRCPMMETPVVTVTPQDVIPPVLTCPPDTTIHTAPGTCQAPFTYADPVMTDNCSGSAPASLPGHTLIGTYEGHTYYRSHQSGPWATARSTISAIPGAQMLVLNSEHEHEWLESRIMTDLNWFAPFWLGLTDEAMEGTWRWVSGDPVTYTDWHPGQPDNSGNYAMLNLYATKHWDDVPASGPLPWIIEFPSLPSMPPVQTSGPASGSQAPLGTSTITYTSTDLAGNTGTCSFSVTVIDAEPPVLNCPSSLTITAASGACTAPVTINAHAVDNCKTPDTITYAWSHAPGSHLPIGVTPVEIRAFDGIQWSATCTTLVEVRNNTPPVFATCPNNIVVNATGGQCGAEVLYDLPEAFAFCASTDNIIISPDNPAHAPGNVFPVGNTSVNWTASSAGLSNTCSFNVTVVDLSPPTLTNCPGDTTMNASSSCGTVVNWTPPTASDNCTQVFLSRSGPAPGSTFLPGTTTVTYTATDMAGNEVSCSFLIRINDVTPPTIQNCPTDIVLAANSTCTAVATWTPPTMADNCPGGTIARHGPAPGSAFPIGTTVVTYVATDAGGYPTSCSFTVTVTAPTVAAGTYAPLCNNAAPITLTGTPAGGTWSGPGTSGNMFSPVGLSGPQTLTYTYTNLNGCSNSANTTIQVHATANVSTGTYGPVCSTAPIIDLSGTPSGGTWSGTGVSGNMFDPASGTQTLTYTLTSANGCISAASTTITVNAAPTVTTGSYGPLCSNAAAINLNGTPAGGTWSGTGVSGNSFNPASGTQTVTYTVTNANGCISSASTTITVNAVPTVTTGSYGPVCSNATAITLNGTPTGGTWSGTGVSGNSFNPASGTQTLTYSVTNANGCTSSASTTIIVNAAPTATTGSYGPVCSNAATIALNGTPSGGTWSGTGVSGNSFNPASGTQTLTYTVTNANGCTSSASTTITVNAAPTVTTGSYGPLCSNATAITLNGTPAGGTWSGTGVSGNSFNPASGTQTLTYTVTNANGCTSSASTTITVNAAPTVTTGSYGPLCSNAATIALNGTPAGGTWSGTGVSGNSFNPASGTQTVTYTVTNASGCTRTASTTITVNAAPTVTTGSYGPLCSNATAITLNGTPAGGTWSGTGVSGNSFNPASGTQTLTYTVTNANGCTRSASTTVTVNAAPTVTTGSYGPVCSNAAPIVLGGTPTGGTWSGPGIWGNMFDPISGTQTVTYTVTNASGCTRSASTTITVNAAPTVTTGSYGPLCSNAVAINLNGTPTGGTWSGTGVSGNTFNPASGTQTVTYTVTNANGCTGAANTSVTVNNAPVVSPGIDRTFCSNDVPYALPTITGSSWSGPGVSSSPFVFHPASVTTGVPHTLTYTVHGAGGCITQTTAQYTVRPTPVAQAPTVGPYCDNIGPVPLPAGTPANGTWSGPGVTGSTFQPIAGQQQLIFSATVNGCTDRDTISVVVHAMPAVDAGSYPDLCISGAEILLDHASPASGNSGQGTWEGIGLTEVGFAPSAGTQTLTYTFTTTDNCQASDQVVIHVHDLPSVSAGQDTVVCINSGPLALQGIPANGSWSISPVSPGSDEGLVGNTYDPAHGTQILLYGYTDVSGCYNSASLMITVMPVPEVTTGTYAPHCASAGPLMLEGAPSGGTWSGNAVTGDPLNGFSAANMPGEHDLTYTYTDAHGCAGAATTTAIILASPAVNAGDDVIACANGAPIVLVPAPVGGTWSGGAVSNSAYSPANGSAILNYSYTDANGCVGHDAVNIQVHVALQPSVIAPVEVCADADPVQLAPQPSGGTWSGGNVVNDTYDPSDGSAELTYTYTDASGCSASTSTTITVWTMDGLAIVDPGTLCASGAPVTLQATHAGGTWSGNGITTSGVFNPAGGTSTVQYNIESGECQAIVSRTIQVDVPGTVSIQAPTTICSSASSLTLTAAPSGGTWSGNGASSSGVFNPQGLLGPVAVTYTVTQGACTISGNAVIGVLAQPTTNAGPDAVACDQLHALQADASAGSGTWTAPSGCILTDAHAPHTTVIFPGTGSYTFTWSEQNGQCTATDQVTITFHDPLDPLWVDAGPDQDFDIYLSTAIPASAAPGTSVQWSVASGMATFLEPTSATTRVTDLNIGDNVLVITASFGTCRHVSDTMTVRVNDVFIPQGFSPNGDGVNDLFEVTGALVFPNSVLRVHDRWGLEVYRSSPYRNEWDGRGHAGAPLPNGTYYYFLELTPTRQYKGFVVIKR